MVPVTTRRHDVTPAILFWLMLSLLIFASCRRSPADEDGSGSATGEIAQRQEEVRFTSGPNTLSGTLFRPAADADCPAVVILAGSDRSARGPLRTRLARHFAAHDVATLVYDSPGTGASTGNALLQTRHERVMEALSAVDHLRRSPGIRSTAVGLFGGSEGAGIALLAAAEEPQVAFVIAVSGALGVSVPEILRYSAEKRGHEQGLTLDEITKAVTFKDLAYVFLSGVDTLDWSLIEARAEPWEDDTWSTMIGIAQQRCAGVDEHEKPALLVSFRQVVGRFENQRWFGTVDVDGAMRRLVSLDVASFFKLLESGRFAQDRGGDLGEISGIRCPVLAIWGQEDAFLPPDQSAMKLQGALAEANHPDHEIVVFPAASHFLTVSGPATEFVSGYLDTMTHWLGRHTDSDDDGED